MRSQMDCLLKIKIIHFRRQVTSQGQILLFSTHSKFKFPEVSGPWWTPTESHWPILTDWLLDGRPVGSFSRQLIKSLSMPFMSLPSNSLNLHGKLLLQQPDVLNSHACAMKQIVHIDGSKSSVLPMNYVLSTFTARKRLFLRQLIYSSQDSVHMHENVSSMTN